MKICKLTVTGTVLNVYEYFRKENNVPTDEKRAVIDVYQPTGIVSVRIYDPVKVFESCKPVKGQVLSIACSLFCDQENKPFFAGYAIE